MEENMNRLEIIGLFLALERLLEKDDKEGALAILKEVLAEAKKN